MCRWESETNSEMKRKKRKMTMEQMSGAVHGKTCYFREGGRKVVGTRLQKEEKTKWMLRTKAGCEMKEK